MEIKAQKKGITFSRDDFQINLQRFPYPEYLDDRFSSGIATNLPFIILLCFIYLGQQETAQIYLFQNRILIYNCSPNL